MLKNFFRKHGWRYAPGAVLVVISAWIQTRSPLALGKCVEMAAYAEWGEFVRQALMILVIALGVFLTRFGWRWFVVRTSREMEVYLRDQLYAHLMNLPMGFYGQSRSGDLMAYAVNDVNAVRMMFGVVVAQVLNSITSVLFSISEMTGGIHPGLTLYSLLPVPLAIIAVIVLGRKIQARARRAQELFSKLSGHVQENIGGMRVIKAFAQEDGQYAEYLAESEEKRRANEKLYFTGALIDPVIKTIFAVSYAVGLIYGGQLVLDKVIGLAEYVAFNSYLTMIVFPVVAMGRISNHLQRGLASYKRLKELMDIREIDAFDREGDGEPIGSGIEANNLSLKYPDAGAPALTGVSFTVKPGGMLGIVGPTGGGKSTVIAVLAKLFKPERGQLMYGGRDICDIPALSLRAQLGYVPQDGFLFDESILENVRFFSDATDEEVMSALADAGMAEDLENMPEGVNTQCGERGNHLSGGQRQRVALARALVRKPRVLLMDDTLSAVDAHTEANILKRLKTRVKGCTCVVVAHRLSAVVDADEILYVDHGRVMERGTHAELIELGGGYAHMHALQSRKEGAR